MKEKNNSIIGERENPFVETELKWLPTLTPLLIVLNWQCPSTLGGYHVYWGQDPRKVGGKRTEVFLTHLCSPRQLSDTFSPRAAVWVNCILLMKNLLLDFLLPILTVTTIASWPESFLPWEMCEEGLPFNLPEVTWGPRVASGKTAVVVWAGKERQVNMS